MIVSLLCLGEEDFALVVRRGKLPPVIMFRQFKSALKLFRSRVAVACNKNNKRSGDGDRKIRGKQDMQPIADIMLSLNFVGLFFLFFLFFSNWA